MSAPETDPRPNLLGLTRHELAAALAPLGEPAYRGRQLWEAIHLRLVLDFEAMTELAKPFRRALAERFRVELPAVADRHVSQDGTTKFLFRLDDGATVEAVDIPDRNRRTLCISSQAGCALACRFCVTGYWGAGRDLTAGEIVGQVWAIRTLQAIEGRLNLVFMGMGEPLLNLAAVRGALEVMAPTISPRRITLSTVGLLPGLAELGQWPERPNLAISLHAPDDRRRSELMPVNRSHPLAELIAALRRYPLEPRRRLTFEYLLIAGFNDADRDADQLASLLRGLPAKVNLIPFNADPVLPRAWHPPEPERVAAFRDRLERHGLTATVRRRRGDDVAAACGQLRAFGREPRGFRRSQLSL
ncbi:MAG TPA: 23S rRNA (adenine(2503)-C(2))-methyltransferase RlmN [Thermoanaerobaculia bacterium]|nr:23S rRNA (adenine(2503)-C(2))-methyltransferase RlmN [Thermoanaerobaculia bacterium]